MKPENIFIDKQNDDGLSIKVIDFGTSLYFNDKREEMGNFGTVFNMYKLTDLLSSSWSIQKEFIF